MPELVLPDVKYKKSFLDALKEYKADKENAPRLKFYEKLDVDALTLNFEEYVTHVLNEALGIGLPEGYVPHTVCWLVDGDQYLGRADIRHQLNDFLTNEGGHIGYDVRPSQRKKGYGSLILKLAIQKAHELGIKDLLVTCDVGNTGSDKVITKNGGVLENTYKTPEGGAKNRYWIKSK